LQALQWRQVDLERKKLAIVATFGGNKNGKPVLAPPKTAKSRRTIMLSDLAVDALRRHRAAQLEHRLQVGNLYHDHGLVFATHFGSAYEGRNLRSGPFARLLRNANLGHMRIHDLRHTAITLLISNGLPVKVVSEMAGHSDVGITLRTYSHVMDSDQERTAQAMDRLFSGTGS
jgi:integrase